MIRQRTAARVALVVAGVALGITQVRASDPIGIYAVVERVSVTTMAGGQPTAQIFGTFAVAVQPPTNTYQPEEAYAKAKKGYMLFTCPQVQRALCEAEWNDLKKLAGSGDVAGFGSRWGDAPRVRAADEPPAGPDTYRMNTGVIKIGKYGNYPSIVTALKAAPPAK